MSQQPDPYVNHYIGPDGKETFPHELGSHPCRGCRHEIERLEAENAALREAIAHPPRVTVTTGVGCICGHVNGYWQVNSYCRLRTPGESLRTATPDPLTGDEPECCTCREHHDPMRNCTDCAWCMNGCPMPWPTPADAEFCKGCDGQ